MKEQLINLIGSYETTQYSWLDIPWCFTALLICISLFLLGQGIFYCIRGKK